MSSLYMCARVCVPGHYRVLLREPARCEHLRFSDYKRRLTYPILDVCALSE